MPQGNSGSASTNTVEVRDFDGNQSTVNRRKVLASIGAGAVAGLAGCVGDDDGPEGLGPQVEPVEIAWWSGFAGISEFMEDTVPILQDTLDALGMDSEVQAVDYATNAEANDLDERTNHISLATMTTGMGRLDPNYFADTWTADLAATSGGNPVSYVSCEYTDLAREGAQIADEEERAEVINESQAVLSENVPFVPISGRDIFGLIRDDLVEIGDLGAAGLTVANPLAYLEVEPMDEDTLISARTVDITQTRNFNVIANNFAVDVWNMLIHSPLTTYDLDYELQNTLAESIEVSEDGLEIQVEIQDATFHNGDPITAEDVRFSFEHRWDNVGLFPEVTSVPYDTVGVIDERTVNIILDEVFAPLLPQVLPTTGIMHRESWIEAGAEENPEEVEPDEVIGSGPFALEEFQRGEFLRIEPHDGHPIYSPDYSIIMQAFEDNTSAYREFEDGNLHVMPDVDTGLLSRAASELGEDSVEETNTNGNLPYYLATQNSFGPTKFRAVRLAIGMALDREAIMEQAFRGLVEPELYCRGMLETHPWGTPEDQALQFTDDPSGDIEGARSVLSEAGFGWDDDGNLYYPSDADLDPAWPEGEHPGSTGEYECLNEDSEYVGS
ncbi:ABC transporter substrate-binding protein [Natrarchaeobius oligotrophus]|uniref:Solute-binding protein family 5 domain-containing protein n=1 Tax=Natrarchaeobius chitinivorans TaxID=1679083 RepID=A0A3N6MDU3_NATCH|nr:ABC transporter substrate-binding protein [Natrarchaeobius chitinivorans]RQG94780.1 hypothetical protein EA472_22150 [Natrarchaeobius chitinivorans]